MNLMELSNQNIAPVKCAKILLNDLILRKIVKHLPITTLRDLRGTCVQWNTIFTPQLKRQALVELEDDGSLAAFTKVMQNAKVIPFSRYGIYDSYADMPGKPDLVDFFGTCGPSIAYLHTTPLGLGLIGKILYELTPELQDFALVPWHEPPEQQILADTHSKPLKLKWLSYGADIEAPDAEHLRQVLQDSAELEELELDTASYNYLPVFRALHDTNSWNKLRILSLEVDFMKDPIEALIRVANTKPPNQLRLTSFDVTIEFREAQLEDGVAVQRLLHEFLMTQAPSLQHLKFKFFGCQVPLPALQIPKLEALTSFKLREPSHPVQFAGPSMQAAFPALKRLKYKERKSYKFRRAIPGQFYFADVEQLRHEGVTNLSWSSSASLVELRFWFPAVTRLEFRVNGDEQDELALLWNNWRALKSVHLKVLATDSDENRLDLDQLLTGVQRPSLDDLEDDLSRLERQVGPLSSITMESLCAILRPHKTRFGIGDQKQLQKFVLEVKHPSHLKFTNLGGYFGIAVTQQLVEFQIKYPGKESRWAPLLPFECMLFLQAALGPAAVLSGV